MHLQQCNRTELSEKSNKIKEGNTHSNQPGKFEKPLQLAFCQERGEKCPLDKSSSVQTFCVSFWKPIFNLSLKMTTKSIL